MPTSGAMTQACSRCGKPLPVGALEGHCPHCLLDLSLKAGAGASFGDAQAGLLPRFFGDYEIISEIARGGMGVVYRARQERLKRTVALKVVLAGQFASRAAIDRFRIEAEAAAALQHPHIITIYEVGETEGQPYFTMELIEGRTLAELVASGPLPPQKAARYIEMIARGVAYAHERGVLHRDLKPSNILVDPFDQPRITDFGLAKQLVEDIHLTVTGQPLGSPGYMAPEQASTRFGHVTKASDIYSLGALLYYLLIGRAPFAAGSMAETMQQSLSNEPPSPRALNPDIPEDLQTICLRCLEKAPSGRYETADAVAEELGRFLCDEPILARPPGSFEKVRRWMRRKPVLATSVAALAFLAFVLVVGAWLAAWRIERARRAERREHQEALRANAELQQANRKLGDTVSVLELERAEALFRAGDASMAMARLAGVLRRDPSNHVAAARIISALLYRDWVLPADEPIRHPSFVCSLALSRSGRYLVTGCGDGVARIWDAKDHRQIGQSLSHPAPVRDAVFSPDETTIATGCEDGNLRLWDWRAGQMKLAPIKHPGWVFSVAFSPDGQEVLTACDDSLVRGWASGSGEKRFTLKGHTWAVRRAVFSPDGTMIATGGYDATARLWDRRTGKQLGPPLRHGDGPVLGVAFSPDSSRLATACRDHTARIWNVRTGVQVIPALQHPSGLNDVSFDPTGRFIVTSSFDNTVRIWESESGRLLSQPLHHAEQANASVFLLNGATLASVSDDNLLAFWNVRPGRVLSEPIGHFDWVNQVQFSPSGDRIATASNDGSARIWDAKTGDPLIPPLNHTGRVQSVCFSPDGRFLATASWEPSIAVWDARTGRRLPKTFPHPGGLLSASFSPDGKRLVSAATNGAARVWDFDSSRAITPPLCHNGAILDARFSPDGMRVVTASQDGTARVWDANTGLPVTPGLVHADSVHSAVFSPDSLRVATASADNTARLWDARTGRPIGKVMAHLRSVRTVAFSPDGRRLVTASLDRTARIWDAYTGTPLTRPMEHDDAVSCASFSPDGMQVLTGSADHTARIWDARTGLPVSDLFLHQGPVADARFSPDGRTVMTAATWPDNAAHRWLNPVGPSLAPNWLPGLAETAAGVSITEQGTTRLASENVFRDMKQRIVALKGDDDFSCAARWFFEDRAIRTISPYESEKTPDYIQRRIQQDTRAGLVEAVCLDGTNSVALARLAKTIAAADASPDATADAINLAKRALFCDPNQAEAGEFLSKTELPAEADKDR